LPDASLSNFAYPHPPEAAKRFESFSMNASDFSCPGAFTAYGDSGFG
jgi:hypothetical protein